MTEKQREQMNREAAETAEDVAKWWDERHGGHDALTDRERKIAQACAAQAYLVAMYRHAAESEV